MLEMWLSHERLLSKSTSRFLTDNEDNEELPMLEYSRSLRISGAVKTQLAWGGNREAASHCNFNHWGRCWKVLDTFVIYTLFKCCICNIYFLYCELFSYSNF